MKVKPLASSRSSSPIIGMIEWFTAGDHEHVERVLSDMRILGIRDLRTGISWLDFHGGMHGEWYSWLFDRLAREVRVLPCFANTPESLGIEPKQSSPPRDPAAYSELLEAMIQRFGRSFEWVELWNEPNNLYDWDWRLDPEWRIFSEMVGTAARTVHRLGKKAVLAGMCPTDLNWLRMMFARGALAKSTPLGCTAFREPGNSIGAIGPIRLPRCGGCWQSKVRPPKSG